MRSTSAKVGEQVRIHTNIPRKFGKGRNKFVHYDGVIHEISYRVNNNPWSKKFQNGYVMLSGNFLLRLQGQWVRSTKCKVALDRILRINRKEKS